MGLRILINNLNSLGKVAHFSLLGLWILSVAGLISLGIQQTSQRAISGKSSETRNLSIMPTDTLTIKVNSKSEFTGRIFDDSDFDIVSVEGEKHIYSDEVDFWIRKSNEGNSYIEIQRRATGATYDDAFQRAENIIYDLDTYGNEVNVNTFWVTELSNKYRDQEVVITFYLTPGTRIQFNSPSHLYFRTLGDNGYTEYLQGRTQHIYEVTNEDTVECLDCEDTYTSEEETIEPETETVPEETDSLNPAAADMKNL